MERILVAVDLSEPSRQAFDVAWELARAFDAKLRVVHVIPPISSPVGWGEYVAAVETEGTKLFEEFVDEALRGKPEPRPEVERRILRGFEHQEILDEAERCEPSLIVLGSHGRSAVKRMFLGSVSSKVLRHAVGPTLIVRGAARRPSRIVAAVELGESTEMVLHAAERWRKTFGATLQVVHVLDPLPEASVQKMYLGSGTLKYEELRQEETRRNVELAVEKAFPADARPVLRFVTGRTHQEICNFAREQQADLLVIGPHEKHGILGLGDTAMRVAHHSPCPVLMARPLPEPEDLGC
jgi:nucleotide-binding universal stress UspA family protein